jgi:hypothetical protein
VNDEDKVKYAAKLIEAVNACLNADHKHGLLITCDDSTETLSLYSINAEEEILPSLITAATMVIGGRSDLDTKRVIN